MFLGLLISWCVWYKETLCYSRPRLYINRWLRFHFSSVFIKVIWLFIFNKDQWKSAVISEVYISEVVLNECQLLCVTQLECLILILLPVFVAYVHGGNDNENGTAFTPAISMRFSQIMRVQFSAVWV